MDQAQSDILINNLFTTESAADYFKECGLTDDDINIIHDELTDVSSDTNLTPSMIKTKLQILINNKLIEKKLLTPEEADLNASMDEKILTLKFNTLANQSICPNCNTIIINEFNYCPICANEITKPLKFITDGTKIDFTKGYLTQEDLKHIKVVTLEQLEQLRRGQKKFEEVGQFIKTTKEQVPIKDGIIQISPNDLQKEEEPKDKSEPEVVEVKIQLTPEQRYDLLRQRMIKYNNLYQVTHKKIKHTSSIIVKKQAYGKYKHVVNDVPVKIEAKIEDIITVDDIIHDDLRDSFNKKRNKNKSMEDLKNQFNKNRDDKEINMEYAAVLYLEELQKNPQKAALSEDILTRLQIDSNDTIIKYLTKNNYITEARGIDNIKANLQMTKSSSLKQILETHNIDSTGKKDVLITKIVENIPEKELNEFNKSETMILTDDGLNFIKTRPQVDIFIKYFKNYDIKNYNHYYHDNKDISIDDLALLYVEYLRAKFSTKLRWNNYARTFKIEEAIFNDKKDNINALNSFIKYFICILNPWMDNSINTDFKSPIDDKLKENIVVSIDNTKLDFDSLHDEFDKAISKIELPHLFIKEEDLFKYMIRIYNDEDIETLNNEINSVYNFNLENNKFNTKEEEEEIIKRLIN